MEFIENKEFNEYVDLYKKLNLQEKKDLVEKEISEVLAVLSALNEQYGENPKVLINREISDLRKSDVTEEDFVEAMFVYVNSIKGLIVSLVNGLNKN